MHSDSGKGKKSWAKDIVFVLVLLLLSISLFFLTTGREEGESVRVEVDGKEVARYPLGVDGKFSLNGGSNILVIQDGKAYLEDANCPDKLCVKQGKIHRKGETITCLPNKLIVTVEKKATEDDVEIIL